MTVYITGGHITPALAVIDEILKKHQEISVIFVGRENAQTSPPQPSRERIEIEQRRVPFVVIDAAKFHRTQLLLNLKEILKIPTSFYTIFTEFRKRPPDVILSFGGYIAIPVCIMGKLFGAKVVTHEQTKVAGLANQLLAYIADVIALSSEESLEFFPKEKSVVTGNPIRESLFHEYKTPPEWLQDSPLHKPLIYITGGSQGSQIINRTTAAILPKLVQQYVVVHQCGMSVGREYLKELEAEREKLPEEFQTSYIVREWIEEKEVSFLIRKAHFVISRAGANTVQELTLAGTPAIFIPLAFAYNDEQVRNIDELINHDASLILLQKDLLPDTLWETVQQMVRRFDKIKENMEKERAHMIKNGTNRVIKLLLQEEQ